ncbi:hypothetical protein D2B33_20910 [Bacillus paralicheniformis]|nr:hypothetical protein D5285_22490 [Bacillus paralicheniformis]QFY40650.1 hypothetical protein D2B33_20910 [Bacillus paralicheniformis]TJW27309.1 hypothetical protein E7L52_00390 [Bacillus paralicheniformis]
MRRQVKIIIQGGLLKGKSVVCISTMKGPEKYPLFLLNNSHKVLMKRAVFHFIGIKKMRLDIYPALARLLFSVIRIVTTSSSRFEILGRDSPRRSFAVYLSPCIAGKHQEAGRPEEPGWG